MSNVQEKIRLEILVPIFIFFLLFLPVFYLSGNLALGFWGLQKIENGLQKNNFDEVKQNSLLVRDSFHRANEFFQSGDPVYNLSALKEKTEKIENIFSFVEISADSALLTISAVEEGQAIFKNFFLGEEFDWNTSINKIKVSLESANEKMTQAQSLARSFSGKEILIGLYLAKTKEEIPKLRSLLYQSKEIVAFLPEIAGIKGRKTYLLLFQNNMELRPAGGFIGSYGLLSAERGRLLDFEVQDVYFADGQLRGHVEPPPKMKEFLGQAGWYLRDSNWDPDFPSSALRAEWFLEKETGRRVDGVIGINLFVVQRILEAFGEIELPDYQEKVNAKNFFERAQFHNEVGFFPGSRAKKDFLGAVSAALFEKLKTAKEEELVKVGQAIYQSLLEKDILISLHEEKIMGAVSKFNWDGALKEVKCKIENLKCFEDYLAIFEANVGVNKANYYLERNLKLETKITTDGRVEKTLTITYQNKSSSEIFPAGRYKNYLRLYVSEGSILGQCRIENARPPASSPRLPQPGTGGQVAGEVGREECRIEETTEHQRKVFGFLVEVPVGEKHQVVINWHLAENFRDGQYRLFWQKQSGSRNDLLAISFSYPSGWQIIGKTESALTERGILRYNTNLSQDRIFDLEFKKAD